MIQSRKTIVVTVIAVFILVFGSGIANADTGPVLKTDTGHYYFAKFIGLTGISWSEAMTAAAGTGGHLATITSAAEELFIETNLTEALGTGSSFGYWLGAHPTSNVFPFGFVWVTGEPFIFTNWVAGEPNGDTSASSPVAGLHFFGFGLTGLWNDAPNTKCAPSGFCFPGYVVEWEPSVITIDGCVTGVNDKPKPDGSISLSAAINACAQTAKNHGDFQSCVASITGSWVSQQLITGQQKGAIDSCTARSSIGK